MNEEQKVRIKEYIQLLDSTIQDDDLIDFIIDEIIERAINYMNRDDLPEKLERVIARTIKNIFMKKTSESNGENYQVSSVSDNGQSISYKDKLITFLSTQRDIEVFEGTTTQLNCYRIAKVVGEDELAKQLQENNI